MRKRAVGWVTPCKWIIQESHRIVALHSRPLSEEQAGGDSWRLELAFFIDLITHREWEDRDTEVWMYQNVLCVCTQVLLHRSVMFKWECRVIFLSSVFFYAVGLHLLAICLKVLTAPIFLSWALDVKGTHSAEDVLHISFSAVHHCCCTPTAPLSMLLSPLLHPLIDWLIWVYEKSIGQPFECLSHWFFMDDSFCGNK